MPAAGRRSARDSGPGARWTAVRLVVHRGVGDRIHATLVHRTGDGRDVWDRRLASVEIPCPPGSPQSSDRLLALGLAVQALWQLEHPGPPPAPAQRAGAPLGGLQGELALDSAGTLEISSPPPV